jgi:hypothetical protein
MILLKPPLQQQVVHTISWHALHHRMLLLLLLLLLTC